VADRPARLGGDLSDLALRLLRKVSNFT
jgi:hypothetical protein